MLPSAMRRFSFFDDAKVLHCHCGSRIFSQFLMQHETTLCGHLVIWSFGQNRFQSVKIRHYIINILIFIYSEQMTESENENDHFDLDQNDHAFWRACIFSLPAIPGNC